MGVRFTGTEGRRHVAPKGAATRSAVRPHPFYLLLNVAVGGVWPGDPDALTTFPATMLVDYVRVYAKA